MSQDSLTRALAFVLGVALFLVVCWGAVQALTRSTHSNPGFSSIETLDSNEALMAVIDSLEAHWNRRVNYSFGVQQDPLNLRRVLIRVSYAEANQQAAADDEEMRLTATIVDDQPKAIIKYRGKNHVVQPGDLLGGVYLVQEIQEKTVTLNHGGRLVVLRNKGLPEPTESEVPEGASYEETPEQW